MRKYYYNNANMEIYTEKEKYNSINCASRFEYIGEYKNRTEAETAFTDKYPMRDIHYNDGKRK